jgi:hypothetical protein
VQSEAENLAATLQFIPTMRKRDSKGLLPPALVETGSEHVDWLVYRADYALNLFAEIVQFESPCRYETISTSDEHLKCKKKQRRACLYLAYFMPNREG